MRNHDQDGPARFLGWFSLSLGLPQLLAPGVINRAIGIADDAEARMWQRAVGVRELAAAAGILGSRRPAGWLWARFAGDVMDLALLGSATGKAANRARLVAAIGAVGGVTALDLITALRLSASPEEGERRPEAVPAAAEREPEPEPELHVRTAVTVQAERDEVYRFWHDFENLPRFMAHVESVELRDERRSHWCARGPAGRTVEWDAEVVEDRPGELIAWRSLPGARVPNHGSVRFVDAPGDQGTEIHLELDYRPPGGKLGAAVATLFAEEPRVQAKDDLRRFKQVMETGEVVRSEGTPEGMLAKRLLKQRPAQPVQRSSA